MFKTLIIISMMLCSFMSLSARTLGYNITSEIKILGPIYGEDQMQNSRITSLLFDQPMTTTPDMGLEPLVFEKPIPEGSLLEDGRHRYVFRLRNDIKWHDNREFTAEDIVFTYKSIKHPLTVSSNAKNKIEGIHNIEAYDKHSLAVYFTTPYTGNLGFLTFNVLSSYYFPEGPPLAKNNRFFTERPIGTGKYEIDGDYHPRRIELKRNENYFKKEEIPENIDRISIRVRDDLAIALETFRIDESINFCPDVPPSEVRNLEALGHISVIPYNEYSWQFIAFNLRKPEFQDNVLRQAINYAVDKHDYNDDIYYGAAMTITGPFPPMEYSYNHQVRDTYNLDEAKNLLTQNGCIASTIDGIREKNGIPLSFKISYEKTGDEQREHLVSKFMESMRLIGIEIISDPLESEKFDLKIREERDFDMVLYEYHFGTDPDITPVFHSEYDRKRGFNVCGLRNDQIDNLLDEVRLKATLEDRQYIYNELHRIIASEFVGVFLWQTPKYVAYDTRHFQGIREDTIDRINIFRFIHEW
jgi:peptide/nickel transport system substrate-binding protein